MASLLHRIADRMGFAPKESVALALHAASVRQFKRTFDAGQVNRLTGDFIPSQVSTDAELAVRLRLMRLRSRPPGVGGLHSRYSSAGSVVGAAGQRQSNPEGIFDFQYTNRQAYIELEIRSSSTTYEQEDGRFCRARYTNRRAGFLRGGVLKMTVEVSILRALDGIGIGGPTP